MVTRSSVILALCIFVALPALAQDRRNPHEGRGLRNFMASMPNGAGRHDSLQGTKEGEGSIVLRVRTVQATGELGGDQTSEEERVVDPNLRDLAEKFAKLPFKTFKLVGTHQEVLPVKKKDMIRLPNGDSLAVRPLYIEDDRIGIWIKWQDRRGASILDTRMHFNCGESMLTGTDSIYDGGMILAINVNPH